MNSSMLALCGIDCSVCPKGTTNKEPCTGCRNGKDLSGQNEGCKDCNIKECVFERELDFCFECTDFPCDLLMIIESCYMKKYNISVVKNGLDMEKYGVEGFDKNYLSSRNVLKEDGEIPV